MIEDTLNRIAAALEKNNELMGAAIKLRESLAAEDTAAPANVTPIKETPAAKTAAPAKTGKTAKPKAEAPPEPEPEETADEDDGLGDAPEGDYPPATLEDIRATHRTHSATDPAKVKTVFAQIRKDFGVAGIPELPEDRIAEFHAKFLAALTA